MASKYNTDSDDSDSDNFSQLFAKLSLRSRHGAQSEHIYSKKQLRKLYRKAEIFVSNRSKPCKMRICNDLYRDKALEYFQEIKDEEGSIMNPYMKDFHGDPKSPVNGRIKGLFFTANVMWKTGRPPDTSIYGERRILIPPARVFARTPKAFFTDFYCVFKTHYITLVLTYPGTPSDRFCEDHLIPFDMDDNPFFRLNDASGEYEVTDGVWVEILVTRRFDLRREIRRGAKWEDVDMTGQRSGGKTGLEKDLSCEHCNL